jgi:hypothetical protein
LADNSIELRVKLLVDYCLADPIYHIDPKPSAGRVQALEEIIVVQWVVENETDVR